ncbi:hypothetical protein AK830_g4271 [Neonectria ditissima]|uniref:C2H2-type domain-containing protein n=1 Tax=Neonectria ditissima TaxID=78410 RepID=A0A0P7B9A6_9HYPO|nr:hypothetical protein AK830_g4271 [Neonectria ditissima]
MDISLLLCSDEEYLALKNRQAHAAPTTAPQQPASSKPVPLTCCSSSCNASCSFYPSQGHRRARDATPVVIDLTTETRTPKVKRQPRFYCHLCGRSYAKTKYLRRHVTLHFTCQTCAESFNDQKELDEHQSVHAQEKPLRCADEGGGKHVAEEVLAA